ncbi:MAG TPA: ATP-binding protein [Actinophytocola sp.]|uniref:ATP-binding protein n=1 Tax=Actinophytocola sp. TaxID=1872138 RepID=UPI002DB5A8B4|nr:ATP-binding protein [Actinophytocola sp.]HEU5476120.1 ATP-binding protein [Actinophytocola sp.]
MPAAAEQLPALRDALTEWARHLGLSAGQVQALRLAAYEALANVVKHAYHPGANGMVDLHAAYRQPPGEVTVTVTDHGRWRLAPVQPEHQRGRGLPLIHGLTDELTIETGEDGTIVRMVWTVSPHPAAT